MKALSGSATAQLAAFGVSHLSNISKDSVIHDNGCGNGIGIRAILNSITDPSRYPQIIWATDIPSAAQGIEKLQSESKKHARPVKTKFCSAEALDFPDETFTQSITNSVLVRLHGDGAIKACREIYRTLKPSVIAVITNFGHVPHRQALAAAHEVTRPANSSPLIGRALRWDDGTLLRRVVRDAGFKDDRVKMEKAKAAIVVEDLRNWEIQTWSVLGRTEDGWYGSGEVNWDKAVQVFGNTLRKQQEVELLNDGRTQRSRIMRFSSSGYRDDR